MLCPWLLLSKIWNTYIWKLVFENIVPHYVAHYFLFKGFGDKHIILRIHSQDSICIT